jgi:RNA polymerase sigma-70 factor (ECF subfamily)
MYQIATRACLTALEQRSRRPMPTGLGAPSSDPAGPLESRPEVAWLEPLPDTAVGSASGSRTGDGLDPATDPAAVVVTRESVRLAFVAALQYLTPLQRATLILRDVLAFSAAETARTLDISVASANSALQRARAGVERREPAEERSAAVGVLDDHERDLLERYMAAFEAYDTAAVVALLQRDATWEMPPFTGWYQGAAAIRTLIETQCPAKAADDMRLVATSANGQPACAVWMRDPDGVHRAFQIHVLDVDPDGGAVRHVSCFFDTRLFERFGLPLVWPAAP